MDLKPQFRTWLKCVGAFAVVGLFAWWIWDNPMFAATPQEPGPFLDYQPEILGALVFLYFFPAILAVAFDSAINPFFVLLSAAEPSSFALSVLGFLVATVVLPLIYGSIMYGILRFVKVIKIRLRK